MTETEKNYQAVEAPNGKWFVAEVDEEGYHYEGIGTLTQEQAERNAAAYNRSGGPKSASWGILIFVGGDKDHPWDGYWKKGAPNEMIGYLEVVAEDRENYPSPDEITIAARRAFGKFARVGGEYADNERLTDQDYIWVRYPVFAS